jgi:hypothetical protein
MMTKKMRVCGETSFYAIRGTPLIFKVFYRILNQEAFLFLTTFAMAPKKSNTVNNPLTNDGVKTSNLSPYVSVNLFKNIAAIDKALTEKLIDERLKFELSKLQNGKTEVEYEKINVDTGTKWNVISYWHTVSTQPHWLASLPSTQQEKYSGLLAERKCHLSVVLFSDDFTVLASTDSTLRRRLSSFLVSDFRQPGGVLTCEVMSEEAMSSAFLKGQARQLWMQGLHRRTYLKPDSKTLLGQDLREAINPFSDQTYRLKSALSDWRVRSLGSVDLFDGIPHDSALRQQEVNDLVSTVAKDPAKMIGVSFRDSFVWSRSTKDFNDFIAEVDDLCKIVKNLGASQSGSGYDQQGYRALRKPQKTVLKAELGVAIDFSFDYPIQTEENITTRSLAYWEAVKDWSHKGNLYIEKTDEERFFVAAEFDGNMIAMLRVQPILSVNGKIDFVVTMDATQHQQIKDEFQALELIVDDFNDLASVWYDKGFVITQREIFSLEYKDVPFTDWEWQAVTPIYVASKEKPDGSLIGHNWKGNSLFDFVVQNAKKLFNPSGDWFLLCDDGSGEIADFIFVDVVSRSIKLIHVKGSSKAKTRDIATAQYEIVVSQAEKNLRFLDVTALIEKLRDNQSHQVSSLTWKNSRKVHDRKFAIDALMNIGKFPDKEVIVFQPHVKKSTWENYDMNLRVNNNLTIKDKVQFLRLKTLLAGLEQNCKSMGARFKSWGDDS